MTSTPQNLVRRVQSLAAQLTEAQKLCARLARQNRVMRKAIETKVPQVEFKGEVR